MMISTCAEMVFLIIILPPVIAAAIRKVPVSILSGNAEYETPVNLSAPFQWIEAFTPLFIEASQGSIINITSLGAELAFPNNPAYVASKGGLKMLTKSLAKDLGKYGIRVNNLGPGYFVTDMTKNSYHNRKSRTIRQKHTLLGRWGNLSELVGPCIFLASNASAYVTGQDLYVDGGWITNGLVE